MPCFRHEELVLRFIRPLGDQTHNAGGMVLEENFSIAYKCSWVPAAKVGGGGAKIDQVFYMGQNDFICHKISSYENFGGEKSAIISRCMHIRIPYMG